MLKFEINAGKEDLVEEIFTINALMLQAKNACLQNSALYYQFSKDDTKFAVGYYYKGIIGSVSYIPEPESKEGPRLRFLEALTGNVYFLTDHEKFIRDLHPSYNLIDLIYEEDKTNTFGLNDIYRVYHMDNRFKHTVGYIDRIPSVVDHNSSFTIGIGAKITNNTVLYKKGDNIADVIAKSVNYAHDLKQLANGSDSAVYRINDHMDFAKAVEHFQMVLLRLPVANKMLSQPPTLEYPSRLTLAAIERDGDVDIIIREITDVLSNGKDENFLTGPIYLSDLEVGQPSTYKGYLRSTLRVITDFQLQSKIQAKGLNGEAFIRTHKGDIALTVNGNRWWIEQEVDEILEKLYTDSSFTDAAIESRVSEVEPKPKVEPGYQKYFMGSEADWKAQEEASNTDYDGYYFKPSQKTIDFCDLEVLSIIDRKYLYANKGYYQVFSIDDNHPELSAAMDKVRIPTHRLSSTTTPRKHFKEGQKAYNKELPNELLSIPAAFVPSDTPVKLQESLRNQPRYVTEAKLVEDIIGKQFPDAAIQYTDFGLIVTLHDRPAEITETINEVEGRTYSLADANRLVYTLDAIKQNHFTPIPWKYADPLNIVTTKFTPAAIVYSYDGFIIARGVYDGVEDQYACRWHNTKHIGYPNGMGKPQWLHLPAMPMGLNKDGSSLLPGELLLRFRGELCDIKAGSWVKSGGNWHLVNYVYGVGDEMVSAIGCGKRDSYPITYSSITEVREGQSIISKFHSGKIFIWMSRVGKVYTSFSTQEPGEGGVVNTFKMFEITPDIHSLLIRQLPRWSLATTSTTLAYTYQLNEMVLIAQYDESMWEELFGGSSLGDKTGLSWLTELDFGSVPKHDDYTPAASKWIVEHKARFLHNVDIVKHAVVNPMDTVFDSVIFYDCVGVGVPWAPEEEVDLYSTVVKYNTEFTASNQPANPPSDLK